MNEQKKVAERLYAKVLDYRKTFNTPEGKRVLYDLMKRNFILAPTYSEGCDVIQIAHREGQRAAVAAIISKLKTDPQQFLQMVEEGEQDE